MINGPILVTERLILRPPGAEDLDGWAAFQSDADTTRFIGGVQSRSEAWRSLCSMAGAWHIRGFAMFSVLLRDSGEWIGRIGPWEPEGWPAPEVGWGIAKSHEGKGYACEAAVACLDYVFDILKWDDVIHIIDPENTPSIALAKRLGGANKGPTSMPHPFQDAVVDAWGQSRAEWQENRRMFK
ncbi:MAG: GNAT family N-acetyltransferase [Blastomonas sp.]